MKIGLLAMSGIRAHDAELLSLGLTLPGFVSRSKQIASLPSLGLLYLGALTPGEHEVKYLEAPADGDEAAGIYDCDLVAISTFTAQVFEAYAIADRLRERGAIVAMGGLHVSVLPQEAAGHADLVLVGEAENAWATVLEKAEALRQGDRPATGEIIQASAFGPVDVADLPVPRYDLLDAGKYNRITVQSSRGCPWRCDFCASNVMLGKPYRKRPPEHVARDIRAVLDRKPNAFIELADDNTFVDKAWGRQLCEAIAPLGVSWFTETDISVADDPELLDAIAEAGCRQLLIGLESPTRNALDHVELRNNFKLRQFDRYVSAVKAIQSRGITVNGCFVLGLDGQKTAAFDAVYDLALEMGLYDTQITVMTPFPGTPLHDRLLAEGRILEPGAWQLCTLFDVNYQPTDMTPDELRNGMRYLTRRLYSTEGTHARRRKFFDNIDPKWRRRKASA